MVRTALLALLLAAPAAYADDFSAAGASLRATLQEGRGAPADIKPEAVQEKSTHAAPPKDDLKPLVIRHLTGMISYCDRNMDDCNGKDLWLRDFAKGIGGGRCNNRGFNCVNEVLDMCRRQAEDGDVTPMYWMACGAMLGKLGERDCAEGRPTCARQLQGAVYFSLRAAAGCHKSYEKDKARQAEADKLIEAFAKKVKQDVKGVYVGHVHDAPSAGNQLMWFGVHKAEMIGTEKVLEFAFERLAWHTAGSVVSAASLPLLAFSGAMLFHEVAAAQMNHQVCLEWNHSYKGSYGNIAGSLGRMTAKIK